MNVQTVLVTSTTAGTKNNNQIIFDLTTERNLGRFLVLNFLTSRLNSVLIKWEMIL